jgi:hypothetical protein
MVLKPRERLPRLEDRPCRKDQNEVRLGVTRGRAQELINESFANGEAEATVTSN